MRRYQSKPCQECPWRVDQPPGRFPPERYAELAKTCYDRSLVQFACHKSDEIDIGCAGWVLAGAAHNLGARFAMSGGVLNPDEISSPYPLFPTYRAMAIFNGVEPDDPALYLCRDDTQTVEGI
jgi:hypothetical protein